MDRTIGEAAGPSGCPHGPAVLSPTSLYFAFCPLAGLSQELHFIFLTPPCSSRPPGEDREGDVDSVISSESP